MANKILNTFIIIKHNTLNVNVEDQNWEEYAVSFFTLMEPDKDLLDLMASTYRAGPPSWARMFFIKELDPNESRSYTSTASAIHSCYKCMQF